MYPNQRTSDDTFEYPSTGGIAQDPASGRRIIWRGRHRGMVPQIGRPPAVDPLTGATQAQSNARNILNPNAVDWSATFPTLPNGQPRAAAPVASEAPTWAGRFPNLPNGQPRVIPPAPMPNPAALPAPAASNPPLPTPSPLPSPAAAHSAPAAQDPLAPVQVPYGTITPAHTWQQTLTAKYPEIGQAGTPHNQAFLEAFKMHNDPARAMETADQVMRVMRGPYIPAPSPNRIDPLGSGLL